jgi:hypothetical protein
MRLQASSVCKLLLQVASDGKRHVIYYDVAVPSQLLVLKQAALGCFIKPPA